MVIDMSPMSSFLTAALYIIGIPAVILSILVWLKIARSFYVDRDYEREMPQDTDSAAAEQHPQAHAERHAASGAHAAAGARESMNARMIQSG